MPAPTENLPACVVERLASYRRHLRHWIAAGNERIYSHDLARLEGGTPAQVRRDLMTVGYAGSPAKGYDAHGLINHISGLLNATHTEGLALVGVGHLGRAILDYFSRQQPDFQVRAAFDCDPGKTGRVIHGCRCYLVDELQEVLSREPARVGIIAVPPDAAQHTATLLIAAGVRGLLNFAPVNLQAPVEVYVENVDIALLLEKVAFFARQRAPRAEVTS